MPYAFANGSGTAEDPYQVWTADDLNGVRDYLDAYFIQMADIDLQEWSNWIPIGVDANEPDPNNQITPENFFTGVYDGNGYKIKNFTSSGFFMPEQYGEIPYLCGLFFIIGRGGVVKKLSLFDFVLLLQIEGSYGAMAPFAFMCLGLIELCMSFGKITAEFETVDFASGFSIFNGDGEIRNSYSIVTIENFRYAGGISGHDDVLFMALNTYSVISSSTEGEYFGIGAMYPDDPNRITNYYNSDLMGEVKYPDYDGVPKTTLEMKQQSTYVGWDFDTVWGIDPAINDGYPYLRVFEHEAPIIDDVIPSYPPASYIKLQFQAGDSEKYDMGIFYTDKTRFRVGDPGAKVNARNSIGKYLRDQTFDERNNYSPMRLDDLLKKILTGAGITDYYVATNATPLGMQFAPNRLILDGINDVLAYAPGWIVREEVTGRVVIGPKDDPEFTQPSRYTFQRDRDIFSREQIKDDQLIYGRVCVHTTDFVVKVYRAVTSALGWLPPAQKTYYQVVPDGTTSQEAAALATELADAMADSGEVETFVCPFRPQIIPGDEAEILDSDGATFLGVITQVKHDFGLSGFYTTIVVDSGGRIGRPRFTDLVSGLAARNQIASKKI